LRIEYSNVGIMAHPVHLHEHFIEVAGIGWVTSVRIKKNTLSIQQRKPGWKPYQNLFFKTTIRSIEGERSNNEFIPVCK
jgi:FtsP/CotA-like multicopper oxidase with cupredoxin domain